MKAVVFRGIGDIRLENVPEPKLKNDNDAIVRLTASAICGTDLHMVRGTFPGMKPGTILGHEGVGVVEATGRNVRNFREGDRVVIGSTIACGACSYCRAGYFSQCNEANPLGPQSGTAFFGGPSPTGSFDGLQAEYARIPYANVGMIKLPEEVTDEQAILVSDIFPTGYFGAELAEIKPGNSVCIFGCGPVGQFAIISAKLMNAGRIFAVDCIESRLEMARANGAECINFNEEDPTVALKELTNGIGPDRVIDCVGVDAVAAKSGPAKSTVKKALFKVEEKMVAPKTNRKDGNWSPGNAPSQVLQWMVESVAKAGTLSIIGVYPPTAYVFPIGAAMNRNLTIKMGNCNHRAYIPRLLEMVRAGVVNPAEVLTQAGPLLGAIEAYQHFDKRQPGWMKVMLEPEHTAKAA